MISPAAPPVHAVPDRPPTGVHPPLYRTAPSPETGGDRPVQEEPDVLIGVPRETRPGETRVAATPTTVRQLTALGHDVLVETGPGRPPASPTTATARPGPAGTADEAWTADVVLHVAKPTIAEVGRLRDGAVLVGTLAPGPRPRPAGALAARPITALAMDAVPRISRAQSLDVLSSMANIAGYRAVIEAAHAFGRSFTGQVTAAGKVPPATVLVVGAGVAGLAAIGAASSLGAVVRPPTSGPRSPSRSPRWAASTSGCRPTRSPAAAAPGTRASPPPTTTGGPRRCTPSRPARSTS
jgi:hypothetical protein